MSFYLDASLLVSIFSTEAASLSSRTWLRTRPATSLAISDWVQTEVASALAMKVRMRAMTRDEHDAALQAFRELSRSFEIRAVSREAFRTAARFCGSSTLGLRSGDALHLAICHEASDTLCTLDRRLAAAADTLGVATEPL